MVTWCFAQPGSDGLARQCRGCDRGRVQTFKTIFFFGRNSLIDSGVSPITKLSHQILIMETGITSCFGGDLSGKQGQDNAVLVG